MNIEDAEEFFDHLEAPLKETYKIPKRKSGFDPCTELLSPLSKPQQPSSAKLGYGDQHKRRKNTALHEKRPPKPKVNNHMDNNMFKSVEELKPVEEPMAVKEIPKLIEAPKPVKEIPKLIEVPKPVEEAKPIEEPKPFAQELVQDFYIGTLPDEVFKNCSESHCGLCDIAISSESTALTHYLGKSHLKEVDNLLNQIYLQPNPPTPTIPRRLSKSKVLHRDIISGDFVNHCDICNVSLSSPIVSFTHFQGQRHLKTVNKIEDAKSKFMTEGKNVSTLPGMDFYCNVCKIDLKSQVSLQEHLSGKPHLSKLKQVNDNKQSKNLYCEICCLFAPNKMSFQAHRNGKKHMKKLLQSQKASS